MKKRILPILLIIILLLTNYSIAVEYTRTGGTNVNSIAAVIGEDTYLDAKYNAKSLYSSNIKIYEFNSNAEQVCTGYEDTWTSTAYSKNKYYIKFDNTDQNYQFIYYAINLAAGDVKLENVATIVYKNALIYNGNTYDVKLNIKEINKIGGDLGAFSIDMKYKLKDSSDQSYDMSTYEFLRPGFGVIPAGRTSRSCDRIFNY